MKKDGTLDRFLAVLYWPWIDLGLLTPQRARRLFAVTVVMFCVIAAVGVLIWHEAMPAHGVRP